MDAVIEKRLSHHYRFIFLFGISIMLLLAEDADDRFDPV